MTFAERLYRLVWFNWSWAGLFRAWWKAFTHSLHEAFWSVLGMALLVVVLVWSLAVLSALPLFPLWRLFLEPLYIAVRRGRYPDGLVRALQSKREGAR